MAAAPTKAWFGLEEHDLRDGHIERLLFIRVRGYVRAMRRKEYMQEVLVYYTFSS